MDEKAASLKDELSEVLTCCCCLQIFFFFPKTESLLEPFKTSKADNVVEHLWPIDTLGQAASELCLSSDDQYCLVVLRLPRPLGYGDDSTELDQFWAFSLLIPLAGELIRVLGKPFDASSREIGGIVSLSEDLPSPAYFHPLGSNSR